MKVKLSISVEEETALKIMEHVRQGKFRNKSRAFEYSINKMLGGECFLCWYLKIRLLRLQCSRGSAS